MNWHKDFPKSHQMPYNTLIHKGLMTTAELTIEDFLYSLSCQPFYWKRFGVAFRSWYFRMTTLTDEDLKNKVPNNPLGIYSTYCDKSIWSRGDGVQNFWISINEGHIDMTYEFFN